jgi:hypothetical protein
MKKRFSIEYFFERLLFLVISFLWMVPLFVWADASEQKGFEQKGSEQLSRLFTTSKKRMFLDRLRKKEVVLGFDVEEDLIDTQSSKPLDVYVQGIMLRRDGRHVVWVNGKNTMSNTELIEGILVDMTGVERNGLNVPMNIYTGQFSMKPGQVWMENTNTVIEAYGRAPLVLDKPVVTDEKKSNKNKGKNNNTRNKAKGDNKGDAPPEDGMKALMKAFSKERRQ